MYENTVIIVRGLPGSGKGHWVKSQDFPEGWAYCSADDFFVTEDGQYNYIRSRQGEAHAWCLKKFITALADKAPCIVVDNTHTRRWEYDNYLHLACLQGYETKVVEIVCQHRTMAKVFAYRNIHNVPEDVVEGMFDRWESHAGAKLIFPGFMDEEESRVRSWARDVETYNERAAVIARAIHKIRQHYGTSVSHLIDRWPLRGASFVGDTVCVSFDRPDGVAAMHIEFPIKYLWMSGAEWEADIRKRLEEEKHRTHKKV